MCCGPAVNSSFFENNAAPDPSVRRWQEQWAPIHHQVFAGLDLTRDIPPFIAAAGFYIEHIEYCHLVEFPKSWTYCCWGTAILKPL